MTIEQLFLPATNDNEGYVEIFREPLGNKPRIPVDIMNIGTYFYTVCPAGVAKKYFEALYKATKSNQDQDLDHFLMTVSQVNADLHDEYEGKIENFRGYVVFAKVPLSHESLERAKTLYHREGVHPYVKEKALGVIKGAIAQFHNFAMYQPQSAVGIMLDKMASELQDLIVNEEA